MYVSVESDGAESLSFSLNGQSDQPIFDIPRAASSLLPKWELMIKLCMLDVVICGDRCGDRARCALKGWKLYKEFT